MTPTPLAWLDVSAGAAGDMLFGALLDAGADLERVQAAVDAVIPGTVRLTTTRVDRAGQRATKLGVKALEPSPHHRTWTSIRALLQDADLDERTRELALRTFSLLADAEGHAHGVSPEDVHFHEVGALDSIADVVGVCAAIVDLGVEQVTATPVAVGAGRIRAAHGAIPVPVPAVAQLSLGWPTFGVPTTADSMHAVAAPGSVDAVEAVRREHDGHSHGHTHDEHTHGESDPRAHDHDHTAQAPRQVGELATPTGLALVRALADAPSSQIPAMTPQRIGVGAGSKDFVAWPNVVRVVIGSPVESAATQPATAQRADAQGRDDSREHADSQEHGDNPPGTVVEVRANIDDLDPRLWPGVLDAILAAGAVDTWLTPIIMKKGRPAHVINALAAPGDADAVESAIFAHTSTLGTRRTAPMHRRRTLGRTWVPLTVPLGGAEYEIRLKMGLRPTDDATQQVIVTATPEFDDVAEAARASGLPEFEALTGTYAQAARLGLVPGAMMGV